MSTAYEPEFQESQIARLIGPDGEIIELPDSLYRLVRKVALDMRKGSATEARRSVQIFTTQQAADILNVSRPHLIKLLESGQIPFVKTGTHRRILHDDLMDFKARRDAQRRKGLAELTSLGQEMGDYQQAAQVRIRRKG